MSLFDKPRGWHEMSYEQQREWERTKKQHDDELYWAEQRERNAREEAEAIDRRRASQVESLRSQLSDHEDELAALQEQLDAVEQERRDLRDRFVRTLTAIHADAAKADVVRDHIARAFEALGMAS